MYITYAESNLDVRLQYSTLMSNIDFWKVDFFAIEINTTVKKSSKIESGIILYWFQNHDHNKSKWIGDARHAWKKYIIPPTYVIDTIQDFLCKLGNKPRMQI